MALVKPIVNDITAFDSTQSYTITFTASGGDQVTKNQIQIVTNDSDETLVYDNTTIQGYYSLSHIIPANTLTNGQYYKVRIKTYDVLNNDSVWSDYLPFYCYSTPTVLLNITEGQQITTSSFNFILTYNQAQNEKIDHAIIQLYNSNNSLISTSGNMYNSNNPPLNFSYNVNGLENDSRYKVKAIVTTIEGTVVTREVNFRVHYDTIISTDDLTAEVFSCDGYIELKSNVVIKIDVSSSPDPLTYIDDKMADLISTTATLDNLIYTSWAKWGSLVIPQNFLLRTWFYPARQPFDCIRMFNDDESVFMNVSLKRGSTTDYLSIRTNNGTTIDNPLNIFCNGNTKVFLWIKVIGNTWEVQTATLEIEPTVLNWNNSTNNIEYNTTSDIQWGNEPYGTFIPSSNNYNIISDTTTTVMVANGIFDHLNLTMDMTIPYSTDIPTVITQQTILNVDFNGTIGSEENYTRLLLKRKDDLTEDWINLVDINNIPMGIPTYIDFKDSFVPTGIEQTYSLITYINNIPSEPYTVKVTPTWAKYFLSDKNNKFVLNYAVIYSDQVQNIQNGVFMPIGAKYPIVIQNGSGNYISGSLQFKILGYQYEEDKRLDRISITKQKEDILKFLTNGKCKCLTDFNGNIYILKVINSPQVSYDANWGNGIPTISFDWVEQGKYNNKDDMLKSGLVDYIID